MNIREFVNCATDGTYDVQWDTRGNPDFIPMELRDGYMVSLDDGGTTLSALSDRNVFGRGGANPKVVMSNLWEWLEYPEVRMGLELFYLGVWTDPKDEEVYFDVSMHFRGKLEGALRLGARYEQQAIWDNKAKEAINVG